MVSKELFDLKSAAAEFAALVLFIAGENLTTVRLRMTSSFNWGLKKGIYSPVPCFVSGPVFDCGAAFYVSGVGTGFETKFIPES